MNSYKRLAAQAAAGLLSVSLLSLPAFAVTGTVDAEGGLRVRSGPGTDRPAMASLLDGTDVKVTGITAEGWYQVSYKDIKGYVSGEYLKVDPQEAKTLETVTEPVYGKVTEGPLNVRSQPSTSGDKVKKLSEGAVVQLLETLDGWYRIQDGYICADYIKIVDASEVARTDRGAQAVAYAKQFLGCPYVYGGASPRGFDCSGFVKYVFANFGVKLERSASAQMNNGIAVSRSELKPGDLVFFAQNGSGRISHVGIYIGGNQFIHASDENTGVIISSMYDGVARGYAGARRVR